MVNDIVTAEQRHLAQVAHILTALIFRFRTFVKTLLRFSLDDRLGNFEGAVTSSVVTLLVVLVVRADGIFLRTPPALSGSLSSVL